MCHIRKRGSQWTDPWDEMKNRKLTGIKCSCSVNWRGFKSQSCLYIHSISRYCSDTSVNAFSDQFGKYLGKTDGKEDCGKGQGKEKMQNLGCHQFRHAPCFPWLIRIIPTSKYSISCHTLRSAISCLVWNSLVTRHFVERSTRGPFNYITMVHISFIVQA